MNANQVVIVVDRESLDWICGFLANLGPRKGSLLEGHMERLTAALDRDPDEMEARIAEAIDPSVFRDDLTWSHSNMPEAGRQLARSQARAVLHALQEGTEK